VGYLVASLLFSTNNFQVKKKCRLFLYKYDFSVLLQDAVLKYNAHYSKRWNFEALHSYFNEVTILILEKHIALITFIIREILLFSLC